jgi:hypothetical protein
VQHFASSGKLRKMTKIQLSEDCGNSPKNQLLQALTVAIARADSEQILSHVTKEVQWSPVGRKPILGSQSVVDALVRMGPATSLQVGHVVSHGRSGAVDGIVAFGAKKRAFCHVYEFASAKGSQVSGITTYSIAIE